MCDVVFLVGEDSEMSKVARAREDTFVNTTRTNLQVNRECNALMIQHSHKLCSFRISERNLYYLWSKLMTGARGEPRSQSTFLFNGLLCKMAPVKCHYLGCMNTNATKSLFTFPVNDESRLKLWIQHSGNTNLTSLTLKELKHRFICQDHFDTRDVMKHSARSRLVPTAVPLKSKPITPQYSKSNTEPQDPLEIKPDEAIQCRFCGQFYKDCVAVSSHKPYLAGQKTALAINHIRIELDFSNDSLPTTVCRHCDTKLHEICEFVKQVNIAQFSLLTVSQKVNTQIVKAEFHDKDEIDTLTLPEVEYAEKTTIKRKSYDKENNISKKKARTNIETEFIMDIDIKEEIFDDVNIQNPEYGDTGTDVKPSESELADSALVYRMSETSDLCNLTKNCGKSKMGQSVTDRGLSDKT